MLPIIHRINTIEGLKATPQKYGVEVDVRPFKDKLILNHEPYGDGVALNDYLSHFKHKFAILDIKAEWICEDVLKATKKHQIEDFFLLGVTPPEMYSLVQKGVRNIAIRFSEVEPIESALAWSGKVDWCWVDVFTQLPLDKTSHKRLHEAGFKLCLVDPERWGRPEDIPAYQQQMKQEGVTLDAVMTARKFLEQWTA